MAGLNCLNNYFMEEDNVQLENENLDETQDSNLESEGEDNGELTKAQDIAKNQRIRAEKAEAKLKELKATDKPAKEEKETPKNENYTLKDIRALNDVHDEDVEEVTEYAKFKGISIAEAKNSTVIKNLLKDNNETRATANATSTGTTKRTNRKDSDETLLNDFATGKVPDTDEGIAKLLQAQLNEKKALAKRD